MPDVDLPARARWALHSALYDGHPYDNRHQPLPPELVAQIPAEKLKQQPNFGVVSHRAILAWLRRHGIETGPIFGAPENNDYRLTVAAGLLRNFKARDQEQAALIAEALRLVEQVRDV